ASPFKEKLMAKTTDPVCGMTVDEDRAADRVEYAGTIYHFCSQHCGERFRRDPASFLAPAAESATAAKPAKSCCGGDVLEVITPPPAAAQAEAVYTRPMHPEVRQQGPGGCPKCGMALEPESPPALAEQVEYTCPMHPEI